MAAAAAGTGSSARLECARASGGNPAAAAAAVVATAGAGMANSGTPSQHPTSVTCSGLLDPAAGAWQQRQGTVPVVTSPVPAAAAVAAAVTAAGGGDGQDNLLRHGSAGVSHADCVLHESGSVVGDGCLCVQGRGRGWVGGCVKR